MGFLDSAGLSYFYNKLKTVFIRSVNGATPSSDGNVQLDVLTIGAQTPALSTSQLAQVHSNIGISYGSALPSTTGYREGEIFFVATPSV